LFYYRVTLQKSNAPLLTYESDIDIPIGTLVSVPLKSKTKQAIILSKVSKPEFDTSKIESISEYRYSDTQLDIAKFMASYYFSTLSEALSLFVPYKVHQPHSTKTIPQDISKPTLTLAQSKAYEEISSQDISLLFGVTSSGKTEIFISLIADTIKQGKSAIMLMPEISLTPQMQDRLERYFGSRVAIWHSKLTKSQKSKILQGIYDGTIDIVAGARSALFVPLLDVGVIIVDEEHDDSYKSINSPRYNARDIAVYMGKKIKAKVLLASATPTPSSYHKYPVVRLKTPYIPTKKNYHFIGGNDITPQIIQAIDTTYKKGEQSLVFVPTRANFKYLYCNSCGKTHTCPYCSVGMALHREKKMLKCHYCNFTQSIIQECSFCGASPLLSNRIGTQEAIEQIQLALPHIKIQQFDKDSITTPTKLKNALKDFANKKSDVLLGTQMLSKGHDYANITLSVITGVDYILGLCDYRARERAMNLVTQIAGRSGRAKEATILIQSNNQEFFQRYLADYEEFIKDELEFLQMASYPPYTYLARVLISNKDDSKAAKTTLDTTSKLKSFEDIEIVGSGKAPIEKIANRYRYHILLKSPQRLKLLQALRSIYTTSKDVQIDIDPIEFS
jgi:primosomal protein N' (replication factor Y)